MDVKVVESAIFTNFLYKGFFGEMRRIHPIAMRRSDKHSWECITVRLLTKTLYALKILFEQLRSSKFSFLLYASRVIQHVDCADPLQNWIKFYSLCVGVNEIQKSTCYCRGIEK